MEVNEAMIDKLASLASLKFNEVEKVQVMHDLQGMIKFIEKMNELDTSNVEPLLHMTANVNITRADEVMGSISNEAALKNATNNKTAFFLVPKVIKK